MDRLRRRPIIDQMSPMARYWLELWMIYILDETYDHFGCADDDEAFAEAWVAYTTDFKEDICDAKGCSWTAKCCESRWVGALMTWTSISRRIWNRQDLLRIGALAVESPWQSLHESLRRTTGSLLACTWTFTCTIRSLYMTCWLRWPTVMGSLLMVFLFILLKEFHVMIESRKRRSKIKRWSHLGLHGCPHRKSTRWNGTLEGTGMATSS